MFFNVTQAILPLPDLTTRPLLKTVKHTFIDSIFRVQYFEGECFHSRPLENTAAWAKRHHSAFSRSEPQFSWFFCLFLQTRQSIVHDTASLTLSYAKMEIKETFWTQLPWKSQHFLTREPNGSQNMMKKVFEGHNNNNWTASATALDSIHYYRGTRVCEEEKVSITHFKTVTSSVSDSEIIFF